MQRHLAGVAVFGFLLATGGSRALAAGHYLFAWAADVAGQGEDFIAVIDAAPASPAYGKLVASAASGIRTRQVHHTEYWMPAGQLHGWTGSANAHGVVFSRPAGGSS